MKRNRKMLFLLGGIAIAVVISSLVIVPKGAEAQVPDWILTDTVLWFEDWQVRNWTVCRNCTIIVNGTLTISGRPYPGRLTLTNSTTGNSILYMAKPNGLNTITIEDLGKMEVLNGTKITAQRYPEIPTTAPDPEPFFFVVKNGSTLKVRDSIIERMAERIGAENDGVEIYSDYVLIENSIIRKGEGNNTYIYNATPTIRGTSISEGNYSGVKITSSSNCKLENCEVKDNGEHGISLSSSSNITITDCSVYNNSDRGISLSSSLNNTITNCFVYKNYYGILFDTSSNINITNSAVYSNSYGVRFFHSSYNQLTYCHITDNINYGIYIYYHTSYPSENNTFHHNNFINVTAGKNAYDKHANYWDDGTEGNYWSDYTGSDVNNDWMGDTPYSILGEVNKDNHPFFYPYPVGNPGKPKGYHLIQDAISDATAGDTIYVYNRTYYEEVDISKTINLVGRERNTTVIDGRGGDGPLFIWKDWVNVSEFSLTNGTAGLAFSGSWYTTIKNCNIYNNTYGVHFYASQNNRIANSTIYNNRIGVFVFLEANRNMIMDCSIYQNEMDGVLLSSPYTTITRCAIYSNGNRGISVGSGGTVITNCKIHDNSHDGVRFDSSLNIIANCSVYNNPDYGLVFTPSSNNQIINCTVYSNGWAICFSSSSDNIITSNSVYSNYCGVSLYKSSNQITNSTISDSTAYDIKVETNSTVTLLNTTFDRAKIYVRDNSSLTAQWYLHLRVVNETFIPIPNANLTIKSAPEVVGKENITTTADPEGWAKHLICTEFTAVDNENNRTPYTPHVINATKATIGFDETYRKMTESKLVTLVLSSWPTNSSTWPMFHRYASRIGYSSSPASADDSRAWINETPTREPLRSSPAVAYGKVFFGADDGKLYCLGMNGSIVWEEWNFTTGGAVKSSPAVYDDKIFVGSDDSYLYAIFRNGTLAWKYKTTSEIRTSPVIYDDQVVVVSPNRIYVFYKDDLDGDEIGDINWTGIVPGLSTSSPAITNRTIFVGASEYIYALDFDNFTDGNQGWTNETELGVSCDVIWGYKVSGEVRSTPAILRDLVIVSSVETYLVYAPQPCFLYGIYRSNGTLKWRFTANDTMRTWADTLMSPAVFEDKIIFGTDDREIISPIPPPEGLGSVYCLNKEGNLLWSENTVMSSSPAIADGKIFFGSSWDVGCLDLFSGDKIWSYRTGGEVRSSPVIVDGHSLPNYEDGLVIVGSDDGRVYAFGKVKATRGVAVTYSRVVVNTGDTTDTFNLTLHNVPEGWSASLDKTNVTLGSGESTIVNLTVTPRPNALAEETGYIRMNETSTTTGKVSTENTTTIVKRDFGIDLICKNNAHNVLPCETTIYTIIVNNTGNDWDTISLEISGVPTGWTALLNQASITLPAFTAKIILLNITVPREIMVDEKLSIYVIGTSEDGMTSDSICTITMVTATKESKTRYVISEVKDLMAILDNMNIQDGIKNSLKSKLQTALDKLNIALDDILDGNEKHADNMLNCAENKINAFINEVEAQRGKKISEEDADILVNAAQTIISHIEDTIATPL